MIKKYLIREIYSASENTYYLLENILTWVKTQKGSIVINKELLDLKLLVNESIIPYEINAKKKNIGIVVDLQDGLKVMADKYTIETVIRNLVNNAIKFTHSGGEIAVTAVVEDTKTVVSIKDNGIGIEKELIDKLFRIDVNVSALGTSNEGGTGLGLILCKEFVEKNNGKIWVQSEQGKGSTFSFCLPNGDSEC